MVFKSCVPLVVHFFCLIHLTCSPFAHARELSRTLFHFTAINQISQISSRSCYVCQHYTLLCLGIIPCYVCQHPVWWHQQIRGASADQGRMVALKSPASITTWAG